MSNGSQFLRNQIAAMIEGQALAAQAEKVKLNPRAFLDPAGLNPPTARDLLAECRTYLVRTDETLWEIRKGSSKGFTLGRFGGPEGQKRALTAYPESVICPDEIVNDEHETGEVSA
jgi:hypothetical protein